jgi:hypothetical protein
VGLLFEFLFLSGSGTQPTARSDNDGFDRPNRDHDGTPLHRANARERSVGRKSVVEIHEGPAGTPIPRSGQTLIANGTKKIPAPFSRFASGA